MKNTRTLPVALAGLMSFLSVDAINAQTKDKPVVELPKPGVPEILSIEGRFVRAAYNNEGYVILGYQAANRSVGEKWLLVQGVRNRPQSV